MMMQDLAALLPPEVGQMGLQLPIHTLHWRSTRGMHTTIHVYADSLVVSSQSMGIPITHSVRQWQT